jgi:hypothetical protein
VEGDTDVSDRPPRPARLPLLELEVRRSERTGRAWYSGWLGKARVIGFEAREPNDRGHGVIQVFVETPQPRNGDVDRR